MKKFTAMILLTATFFLGLGGLIESVGARFKSDERALEIMRQARQAIGGEANINQVQSLTVTGKTTKIFDFDNAARTEKGDWELSLQLPNRISKMVKIGVGDPNGGEPRTDKKFNVVVVRKADGAEGKTDASKSSQTVTVIKKGEGDEEARIETNGNQPMRRQIITEDVDSNAENFHRHEFFRTMIFLLLTAPQNANADYVYAGDATVDGANCEIVQINSADGGSVKIYFNKSLHLPVMASYTDAKPMVFRINRNDADASVKQDVKVFTADKTGAGTAEFQIKFSDYRSVSGVQFPHRWTQTMDGAADETIEVSNYEVNPANIADKFKNEPQKIMLRTKKPE